MSEGMKDPQQLKIAEGHDWKHHQDRSSGGKNGEHQSALMS